MVPFRVSGAAADQSLELRLFQIGPYTIFIKQNPKVSAALRAHLTMARAYVRASALHHFPTWFGREFFSQAILKLSGQLVTRANGTCHLPAGERRSPPSERGRNR